MGVELNATTTRRGFLARSGLVGAQLGMLGGLSGVLAACGGADDPATSEPPGKDFTGELNTLLGSHMDPVVEIAKLYERKYGVKPKVEKVTTPDLRNKVATTFLARTSPWDSVFVSTEIGAELIDKGWLREAGPVIDGARGEGTLMDRSLGAATVDGTVYGVPWTIGCPILHWNKELLERADLDPEEPGGWHAQPESWDTMVSAARKLTKGDVYGYTDNWAGPAVLFTWGSLVQMHGGSFLDESGQPVMNSEAGVAATAKLVDLLHTHKVIDPAVTTYTWVFDASPAFLDGRRGFFITWPFIAGLAASPKDSKIAGKNGFAPNPAVETSASVDGSEFLAVPTFADNSDEAWRFIELVASREGQEIVAAGSWAPIYAELLEKPEHMEKFPVYEAVRQSYQYPVDGGWSADRTVWAELLANEIHEALGRKKRPQQAMDDAVKAIQAKRKG
jgi:multiple sugar transport system substrate-binding protein